MVRGLKLDVDGGLGSIVLELANWTWYESRYECVVRGLKLNGDGGLGSIPGEHCLRAG